MKLTIDWLKDHINTNKNESQIIEKLNSTGIEVENVESKKNELSDFIVAKIVKSEKHPNADRLKLCFVDTGQKGLVKVDLQTANLLVKVWKKINPKMKKILSDLGEKNPAGFTIQNMGS